MSKTYSAGIVTAYGAAKRAGYQGTYEDFCRQQAGYAGNAAAVEQAKTAAQTAANTATTKAGEATTAATAAQTAKTQTEAAASQALTDISTAESGAISAVQTEGATQTANATAQAQAAATSATTASTKASEASASATTATTKATEAAASATSAANAASAAQGVLESIPEDYSDLSEDVDQLKADLETVVYDAVEESVFVNYGALTGSGINATNRWMVGDKIPAGTILKSVGITISSVYSSINQPLVIEVFEVSGGELTKVKEVQETIPTASAGQYVSISLDNYKANNPVYVSFSQTRTMVTYTSGGNAIKYTANKTSDTLSESALSTFDGHLNVDINIATHVSHRIGDPSLQILHIGEGYQYDQIQDALDDITDDSAVKPYTLIVHPKSVPYTRFSMIRKLTDAYPWTNAPVRHVSIIGIDRYHCIVEDTTGNYANPPAEILTNGLIKNITFRARKTNQDTSARQGAYAVHIDAEPVGNIGYEMRFESCTFDSDQTAGVGIGLHNACHLLFENCEFISTASGSYSPYSGYTNIAYLGAFNCHSSTNQSDTDQLLTLVNCVAMANENKAYTFATNANCYMTLRAYNNTFWCVGTNQANGYKGSYCTIYGANHGNNVSVLNA